MSERSHRCVFTGKRRYVTEAFALDRAGASMRAYACVKCKGFHLTRDARPDSDFAEIPSNVNPVDWARAHGLVIAGVPRANASHRRVRYDGVARYYKCTERTEVNAVVGVIRFVAWVNRGTTERMKEAG